MQGNGNAPVRNTANDLVHGTSAAKTHQHKHIEIDFFGGHVRDSSITRTITKHATKYPFTPE